MNTGFRRILILILAIGLAFTCMAGCSDDDDNLIQVCNYDNEDYEVRLYEYDDDDEAFDKFDLDKWYELGGDICDEFKDVPDGYYYITIHEDGSSDYSDKSGRFHMDDDEARYFWIDSSGDIDSDD